MERVVDTYRYVFIPQSVMDAGEGWVYFSEINRHSNSSSEARKKASQFASECEEEVEAFCLSTSVVGTVYPSYDDEESWGDTAFDERFER